MGFLIDLQGLKSGLVISAGGREASQLVLPRQGAEVDKYKTISLKTADINEARDRAFDHDADIRFRVKHEVPVFEKSFAEVAKEYGEAHKKVAESGQITMQRWKTVDGHIRLHLIPYIGNLQIVHVAEDRWKAYPLWRKENGKSLDGKARDGSIARR